MERVETIQDQLFQSIWKRQTDLAKRILTEHPELINAKRIGDWEQGVSTPLVEACNENLHEVVIFLLDNGADVSATGNYVHFIPLHKTPRFKKVCQGGFGSGDDVFPLFVTAANHFLENEMTIDAILAAGADINQRTAAGQTILHILCSSGFSGAQPFKSRLMKTLIDHGADINICDHHGKSPLHYAAQRGFESLTEVLLRNGANLYEEDLVGLTALDYAATHDYRLTIALLDNYIFPIKQIIRAYECVASIAPNPCEMLRKATFLRETNGIPKKVLPPLECYGYEKEWETIEELEKYRECETLLRLQSLLAKERISIESNFDIACDRTDFNIFEELLKNDQYQQSRFPKYHFNSLWKHQMDSFSYFGKHLYLGDLIHGPQISLRKAAHSYFLSTDVLVKFVQVTIESCFVMQNLLNLERKPGCVRELIVFISSSLYFAGCTIVHLIKRGGSGDGGNKAGFKSNNINHGIAKTMLDELLHRCPTVSAPLYHCSWPVINVLFKREHFESTFRICLTRCCFQYYYYLMKMVIEAQRDINATDCDGNTILHIVISEFIPRVGKSLTLLHMVETLLENGAYPHAKNKQGQYPADALQVQPRHSEQEKYVIASIRDLFAKYDWSLTLKYMAAMKIKDSEIPYKNQLPNALVKFVDLH